MSLHIHIHYNRDAEKPGVDRRLIGKVMMQVRRGGNTADNLKEHGVEDLMDRYRCNRETAQELYRQIQNA